MIIKINNSDKPVLLSDYIRSEKGHFDMPCGGQGTCKKCRVKVSGSLSELTDIEKKSLTADEISSGIRLACQTYVTGDAVIDYNSNESNFQGITFGNLPDFELKPVLSHGKGAAVDIGTTTVALYIYDFEKKSVIAKYSEANEQRKYGADIISRIEYSNNNGFEKLTETIRNQIDGMIKKYCDNIAYTVITGNTTMLHFYCGLDPKGIAVSPFIPQSLFGNSESGKYFPHCISSYVGADITCAVLASGMTKSNLNSLLIDIGTNGEMALWHNDRIYCCSTAAGPAFEGAGISSGMPGCDGAIDKVFIKDGKIAYTVIGNKSPEGICGSGIIDATAVMIENGIIDETGVICEEDHAFTDCIGEDDDGLTVKIGDSGISLTQKDIRQIQLAKSAICAGIYTLMSECGLTDIDVLYLAGGFGSFINKESAGTIGLFPKSFTDKVKVIGNGAGMGALMHLMNKDVPKEEQKLVENAAVCELSTNPVFMDKYIECMMFMEE